MFPSFLDGTATTTPPDLDLVREAPKSDVNDSFENHLQRTPVVAEANPDTKEAHTADEDRDEPVDEVVVTERQSEAKETSQEDSKTATDETNQSDDAEIDHGEDESVSTESNLKDEVSTVKIDAEAEIEVIVDVDVEVSPETNAAPETTPIEDLRQTELVEPALEDETGVVVTVEDPTAVEASPETVDLTTSEILQQDSQAKPVLEVEAAADGVEQIKSEDSGQEVSLAIRVAEDAPASKEAGNALMVDSDLEQTVTTERATVDPKQAEADAAVTVTPSKGDVQQGSGGGTDEGPRERHQGSQATSKGADAESGVAAKQIPAAVALTAMATESEANKKESSSEIENRATASAPTEGKPAAAASPQSRFVQQLNAAAGERASRSSPTENINQSRFVDRVARAFRATNAQDGTVKLRLHPPELGVLQVHMKVQGNALTAKLEAETPAARALLIETLPVLRERLAEQGIRIEQFDIDLMERQPQNLPDETGERPDGEDHSDSSSRVDSAHDEPNSGEPRHVSGSDQQLDIIV